MLKIVEFCFIVPIGLLLILIIHCYFLKIRKRKMLDESLKNFYWLKNSKHNENLEQKTYDMGVVRFYSFMTCIIFLLILIFLRNFNLYNFYYLHKDIFGNLIWNFFTLNLSVLTVVSIVVAVKKDYYLAIDVKDVLQIYGIPNNIMTVFYNSGWIVFIDAISNVSIVKKSVEVSELIKLSIYSLFIWLLINVMLLIYKTIKLCINNSKKEMKAFKCLRYKIAFDYFLPEDFLINRGAIERISSYLIDEIEKKYKAFLKNDNNIKDIYFNSLMVCNDSIYENEKKYSKRIEVIGTQKVLVVSLLLLLLFYVDIFVSSKVDSVTITWMALVGVATILIILLGYWSKSWGIFVANRVFWVFSYSSDKKRKFIDSFMCKVSLYNSGKEYIKIAAFGFNGKINSGYEFISSIEDLLGLYKLLLYSDNVIIHKEIVLKKVKDKLEKENQKRIKNTILLLMYYLEYEKCYSLNYYEILEYITDIDMKSVEYKLADSILKHIYKESERVNGKINPRVLKNYKFESYFKFLKRQEVSEKKKVKC